MLETALAKLLTLKVGAAALAVTATGGVALAAANGTLPNPIESSGKPAAHATGKPSDAGKKGEHSGAKGTPSPSMDGLCRAYVAGAGQKPDSNSKALENPAFSVLITTAGGKEKVAAYCDGVLATADKGKAESASSARPTAVPTRSAGKPETRPAPAGTKPTGTPDDRKPAAPTATATSTSTS